MIIVVGECSVFVMYDGGKIVFEVLYISFVKSVFVESIFEICW